MQMLKMTKEKRKIMRDSKMKDNKIRNKNRVNY